MAHLEPVQVGQVVQLSNFHFSMSQNRIQTVSMKTIQIKSKKFWLCVEKNQSPTSIHEKTKHLELSVKKTKHLELSDFFNG